MSTFNEKILNEIEGIRKVKDALVVLVKTEWNASIVDELESGCMKVLDEYDVRWKTIIVPGAVEIAFAINHAYKHIEKVKAFIALGCIIKGDTPHFDYVCKSVTDGITQLNIALDVPTIFGVLTVNNEEQAKERIGGAHGHKGEEAAITALKMIALTNKLKKG
jgi:6,7-dimethyl-8-ribityllumazine synthase